MIRNIILALVGFVIVALIVLWVLNGGPWRAYQGVRNFTSMNATTSEGFSLPWQSEGAFPFVTDEELFMEGEEEVANAEVELATLQQEYAALAQGGDAVTFGNPSPLFRAVRIAGGFSDTRTENVQEEYIVIEARLGNTAPISLAGWSLQSVLSGTRIYISNAASPFSLGTINTVSPVSLEPGGSAILNSGPSPVGVSFRENVCTGYLGQFQTFIPPLSLRCAAPESELPLTPDNLQRYGEACFDFVRSIPTCEFPKEIPGHISPQCRSFAQTILSYSGCVSRHFNEPAFAENSWRLYLGSQTELWRNLHDAIRLLDAQGQTVDVYVY